MLDSPCSPNIRIERVGGGASPEGYIAFDYSGPVEQPLPEVEDWKEEDCFFRALCYLLDQEILQSFDRRAFEACYRNLGSLLDPVGAELVRTDLVWMCYKLDTFANALTH